MASGLENIETIESPFRRFVTTIGVFPTAFTDAMTYYECLAYLVKYLEETVIPAVNENAEALEELQTLYVQLKSYVDNYFDNLDIQKEINNKLDEMAESGQLADIIAQYLQVQAIFGFDTIAEMSASENLANGSICKVLGKTDYKAGDGGFYKIRTVTSDDVIDGVNIVAITNNNTLIAELITDYTFDKLEEYASDNEINVKFNGVAGDGLTDDTATIQALIDNNPHKTLYFPAGKYLISAPLHIYAGNAYQVNLHLDKNATIKTATAIDALLIVGENQGTWERYEEGSQVIINGGIWDGTNTTSVIKHLSNRKETTFENITVYNVNTYGLNLERGTVGSVSSDCRILNCNIYGVGSDIGGTAILLDSSDNEIDQLRTGKTKVGINDNYGGNLISNIHILASYSTDTPNYQDFNACQGLIFGNGNGESFLNNIYIDDYAQAITVTSVRRLWITNLEVFYYTNRSDVTCIAFNILTGAGLSFKLVNGNIHMPASSTNKGLYISQNSFNQYVSVYNSFNFTNLRTENIKDVRDQIFNLKFKGEDGFNVNDPWVTNLTQNAYHVIGYLNGGYHDIKIQMANDQIIEAKINVRDTNPIINITNILNNAHGGQYYLALCNGATDEHGNYGAYLCIKSSASGNGYNPAFVDGIEGWNTQLRSYRSVGRTPLASPTVNVEASFNP